MKPQGRSFAVPYFANPSVAAITWAATGQMLTADFNPNVLSPLHFKNALHEQRTILQSTQVPAWENEYLSPGRWLIRLYGSSTNYTDKTQKEKIYKISDEACKSQQKKKIIMKVQAAQDIGHLLDDTFEACTVWIWVQTNLTSLVLIYLTFNIDGASVTHCQQECQWIPALVVGFKINIIRTVFYSQLINCCHSG